jgi:hypothetical protein
LPGRERQPLVIDVSGDVIYLKANSRAVVAGPFPSWPSAMENAHKWLVDHP